MPMSADDNRAMLGRWLKTAAVWVVVCAGSVCAALLGVLSVERLRSPVDIQNAYVVLVIAQTFFMIFLWPLFVRAGSWWNTAVQLVALFALAVPLILVTLRTSDVRVGSVLGSQALVLLFGVTAAAAMRMPGRRLWFYPAAFVLSAVAPLVAYASLELGGLSASWAARVSPFWAVGDVAAGGRPLVPLLIFGGLAVAMLVALRGLRLSSADHA